MSLSRCSVAAIGLTGVLASFCLGPGVTATLPYGTEIPEDLSAPSVHDHVLIVGGGIAGLHMARQLARAGVERITILEKSNRICGKIRSPEVDGVAHDMAATLLGVGNSYGKVFDLADEFELELISVTSQGIFMIQDDASPPGAVTRDMDWYSERSLAEDPTILAEWDPTTGLPGLIAIGQARAEAALSTYFELHTAFMGQSDYNRDLPKPPDDALMAQFAMTADEFIEQNGLSILRAAFEFLQPGQFYGKLNIIPAYYLFLWANPAFVRDIMAEDDRPISFFKDGYESLCKALHDDFMATCPSGEVFLNFEVDKIERPSSIHGSRKIKVHKVGPDFEETPRRSKSGKKSKSTKNSKAKKDRIRPSVVMGDFLVMAVPQPGKIQGLEDENMEFFGTQVGRGAQSFVATTVGNPNIANFIMFIDRIVSNDPVVVAILIDRRAALAGRTSTIPLDIKNQTVYISMDNAFEDPLAIEDVAIRLQNFGYTSITELDSSYTPLYLPYFMADDILAKKPWRILGIQGYKNTWFIGCSAIFEAVNLIFLLNDALLEKAGLLSEPR